MRTGWIAWACAGLTAAACSEDAAPRLQRSALSEAYCQARVTGVGVVDVETDYLPRVVTCENGAAGLEALEAQAVAARSYLYYKLDRDGEIADSPGDQVYGCGREPTVLARAAVRATSGLVLTYRGVQVAGFHVAGARHHAPSCRRDTGQPVDDPTDTEPYVTYNAGRRGRAVSQTPLGMAAPDNLANRGCKSQNGAACLAAQDWDHEAILRFYYGEDIGIMQARGPCIEPLPQAGPLRGRGGPYGALLAMAAALVAGWLVILARTRRGRGRKRRQPRRKRRT